MISIPDITSEPSTTLATLSPSADFVPFTAISLPSYVDSVYKKTVEYYRRRWPQPVKSNHLGSDFYLFVCPSNAPEERAEVAALWSSFLALYDDYIDGLDIETIKESVRGVTAVMLRSSRPQNEIEEIVDDICSRTLSLGSDHSRKLGGMAIDAVVQWMEAALNHDEKRKGLTGGIDHYLKCRILDVGYGAAVKVPAWEMDLPPLSQRLLDDRDFDSLHFHCAVHTMFINDMYSYRKEIKRLREIANGNEQGEAYMFNVINILLEQDGVNESNVMNTAGVRVRKAEFDFNVTAEILKTRYNDSPEELRAVDAWIELLITFMAGNHLWSSLWTGVIYVAPDTSFLYYFASYGYLDNLVFEYWKDYDGFTAS